MLSVVHVWPEETLDLAPLADRREERAVAENRGRTEREPAPGVVQRARDVGMDGHQRGLTESTGDVDTEPSLARTAATRETVSPSR